ncbi:MAG: glycoside hydrolase [Candidatus Tyrphobacter sp.]
MLRSVVALGFAFALLGAAPLPDLHWRFIGPLRGGRTDAVAGVASRPDVFYIGSVNGGIWRTDDAGRTWTPIFDDEDTGSIGALAVAPSDPDVVYAASGEGLQRPDLAVGDGIYTSTNAGRTWTHRGLRDGEQIPAIAVDPKNAQRLFVAVLGHPYGPNVQRGVYRSTDGGAPFTRVLYENENVGAYDVVIDPNDSSVVYATLWAARQPPWETPEAESFEVPGSGIFKSTDGGTTWTQLHDGLPSRVSRCEVAVAPSDSSVVYAYVNTEAHGAAVYRSDDGGLHFAKRNAAPRIAKRGDDLASIAVDPRDPNVVYVTNTSTYRSRDGGATFVAIKGAPGGDDYHTLWINPSVPDHVIVGSDQGATISVNDGRTWSSWYNQPTAEMYHVNADDRFPYWVCGGQQESGSACVLSRGAWGEITERDWHPAGAEEYGYVVPDPLHPGVFYGGRVERFDEHTGQTQEVSPIATFGDRYRMDRTERLAFDPLRPTRLFFAANVIFVTSNGGHSWTRISPDLTRKHPRVPGVIRAFEGDDPQHGTHRGAIYALAPSYVHEGTIWAGTDDGLVWITRDGGRRWTNVTPPGLTAWSKISQIDASHFNDDTAYVAVNRFRLDDLRPYVYRTHDGGSHWSLVVDGLPREPVNAVRADPDVRGLLYAATEDGVDVSFDDGAHWQSLERNLPHTSVRDLIVHDEDLVVATHGRGFWILDDIEPLRELAVAHALGSIHLFKPALAYRVRRDTNTDTPLPPEEPHGQNPPNGAIFDYALASPAAGVTLSIYDGRGRLVRRYSSDDRPPAPITFDKPSYWEASFVRPSAAAGMHRFVWDLHEAPPHVTDYDLPISAVYEATPRVPQGALVPPGTYVVALTADGRTLSRRFTVRMDPRVHMTQAQLETQYQVAHGICTLLDRIYGHRSEMREAFALEGLLSVVDGSDAPVTAQALAAYGRILHGLGGLR